MALRGKIEYVIFDMDGLLSAFLQRNLRQAGVEANLC